MLEKLNYASVSAYVRWKLSTDGLTVLERLKEDEHGVHGIVILVLQILVAILLIVMFK